MTALPAGPRHAAASSPGITVFGQAVLIAISVLLDKVRYIFTNRLNFDNFHLGSKEMRMAIFKKWEKEKVFNGKELLMVVTSKFNISP